MVEYRDLCFYVYYLLSSGRTVTKYMQKIVKRCCKSLQIRGMVSFAYLIVESIRNKQEMCFILYCLCVYACCMCMNACVCICIKCVPVYCPPRQSSLRSSISRGLHLRFLTSLVVFIIHSVIVLVCIYLYYNSH